jgi:hypothetical protein
MLAFGSPIMGDDDIKEVRRMSGWPRELAIKDCLWIMGVRREGEEKTEVDDTRQPCERFIETKILPILLRQVLALPADLTAAQLAALLDHILRAVVEHKDYQERKIQGARQMIGMTELSPELIAGLLNNAGKIDGLSAGVIAEGYPSRTVKLFLAGRHTGVGPKQARTHQGKKYAPALADAFWNFINEHREGALTIAAKLNLFPISQEPITNSPTNESNISVPDSLSHAPATDIARPLSIFVVNQNAETERRWSIDEPANPALLPVRHVPGRLVPIKKFAAPNISSSTSPQGSAIIKTRRTHTLRMARLGSTFIAVGALLSASLATNTATAPTILLPEIVNVTFLRGDHPKETANPDTTKVFMWDISTEKGPGHASTVFRIASSGKRLTGTWGHASFRADLPACKDVFISILFTTDGHPSYSASGVNLDYRTEGDLMVPAGEDAQNMYLTITVDPGDLISPPTGRSLGTPKCKHVEIAINRLSFLAFQK